MARRIISHGSEASSLDETIVKVKARIDRRGDTANATVGEQLELLNQLADFPFGRFLLLNRGWNGYWTDFVMQHPRNGRRNGAAPDGRLLTPLERQLLDTFPMILATQERSRHFADAIQGAIKSGMNLASIPCGLMRDLLARDYSHVSDVRLTGIDLDKDSLAGARQLAEEYGLSAATDLLQRDAWDLHIQSQFDLIASNGLNTYEPDDDRVTDLYRHFNTALQPGGLLVTSFLTPPPDIDPSSEWNMQAIDPQALRLQQTLFVDVIGIAFQCYRSSEATIAQLNEAGFTETQVIWDRARIYPTVLARKAR